MNHFGWVQDQEAVDQYLSTLAKPMYYQHVTPGFGKGKQVLIYKYWEQLFGPWKPHFQEIGDCVSHGWGSAIDMLTAMLCVVNRAKWKAEVATELVYGGSRVEVGGSKIRGDGSVGAWAAECVHRIGTFYRLRYTGTGGKLYDFTKYTGAAAKQYGRSGIPDDIEIEGLNHTVQDVASITTYDEARDAIAAGHLVPVCSNVGFTRLTRDSEGFQKPSGRWAHCMFFAGVDDSPRRPGLLLVNSHGDNVTGPTYLDNPPGSWWVDANVADSMLGAGDSNAISGIKGFEQLGLNYDLY